MHMGILRLPAHAKAYEQGLSKLATGSTNQHMVVRTALGHLLQQ